jgi:hypothetical protein
MTAGKLLGGAELSAALTLPLPAIVRLLVMPETPVPVTAAPDVDKAVPCGSGSCTVEPGGPAHAATPMARTAVNTAKRFKNTAYLHGNSVTRDSRKLPLAALRPADAKYLQFLKALRTKLSSAI